VAKLRLARIDFDAGRRAQAYGTITEVLRRDSKNEQALETKARFLINEEKYADALSVLNPVIQANSSARSSLYLRGIALEGLRSSDEAIRAFQQLLQVDPAAVPAQLRLAVLYLARGEANTAIHFIGPLIKSQPSEALRLLYAKALLQAGDIGRADSELAALAMANPASAEVHTLIGHVHLARRDFARAGEAYERAFQLQPNSSEALAGLVQIDIVQKRPDAARRRVEKQLTARKQDPAVMMIAGNTYMSVGDPAAAAAAFEKAVELDPKNIEAFSKLGAVYMAQHRLDEGRKHYEDAARRFSNPIAATMAGIILELQKKPEEARQQYERALAIDSRSAVAANNLAWIQAETGSNLDMALQLAQTAKAQLPKHGQVSDTLGWIYYKKGLAQLAVAALREGATQSPSDPAIHYHLGLAYIKNGNTAEAKGALERALRLDPQFRGADDARRLLGMITS
jgi:Flp pilus assembly protein TadD